MKSQKKIIFFGLIVCFILVCFQFLLQIRYLRCPLDFGYDEGVLWQTIRLLNRGYFLFTDIYYAHFPLFIQIARFFHNICSEPLFGARLANLLLSLPLVPIMYVIGFLWRQHKVGIVAAVLTALNIPLFADSHILQGIVPSLTFALASLACALMLFRHPGAFWGFYLPIIAAAFLLAISFQLKMIALPSLAVIYLVLFFKLFEGSKCKSRMQYLKLVLQMTSLFFLTLGVCFVAMLLITGWSFEIGFNQLNAGVFSNFFNSLNIGHINLEEPLKRIHRFLNNTGSSGIKNPLEPILCLSLFFFVKNKKTLFIPFVWLLIYIFAFLFYEDINNHYIVFLEPAYILVIAISSIQLFQQILLSSSKTTKLLYAFILLIISCGIGRNFYYLISSSENPKLKKLKFQMKLVQDIQKNIPKDKFLLSDRQFLIAMADRNVPPWFADTSHARIRSGALDCAQLIACLNDDQTAGVLISKSGRFMDLKCKKEFMKEVRKLLPHSKRYKSNVFLFWKSY